MPYISTEDCTGISTGQHEIDRCIGDGIPKGSLTLSEGNHAAGKTVLCQNLTYSALHEKSSVAFYTSETSSPSMISRMSSLRMDVLDYFLLDQQDAALAPEIEELGMTPLVAPIIMESDEDKVALANYILSLPELK